MKTRKATIEIQSQRDPRSRSPCAGSAMAAATAAASTARSATEIVALPTVTVGWCEMLRKSRQNATGSVHSATLESDAADAVRLAASAGLGSDPSDNAGHYILVRMRSRALRRRSATALGVYISTILGFSTTIIATRVLGVGDYARFAAILAATAFFQLLLDLTVEDALVKYGFRYIETQRWGRLRRMFEMALAFKVFGGVLAGIAIAVLAPFAQQVWGVGGVLVPMLIASLLPVIQAPEGVAGGAIMLRGRYDIRGWFYSVSTGARLLGIGIGATYGLDGAVIGLLLGQVVTTTSISLV